MRIKLFALGIATMLLTALGCSNGNSSSSSGPEIENESAIKHYIKGDWQVKYSEHGINWFYRFRITDATITYWSKYGEWGWKPEPEGTLSYELSSILRDASGRKFRIISYDTDTSEKWLISSGRMSYDNNRLKLDSYYLEKGWK